MKKLAVLMTLVVMLFAMPLAAYAEQPATPYAASMPATPNWDLAISAGSDLYIDGTTATCISTITGGSSVTSITIEQTLQKEGFLWIYSKYDDGSVWTTTVNKKGTSFTNEKSGLESGKYRVKSVFTLNTSTGKSEKITIYSDPVKIP